MNRLLYKLKHDETLPAKVKVAMLDTWIEQWDDGMKTTCMDQSELAESVRLRAQLVSMRDELKEAS